VTPSIGTKGHDVGGAEARMHTPMHGEIDQLGSLADAAENGFHQGFRASGQGDDRAIVVGVRLAVEQVDAVHPHGLGDGVNLRPVAALGEVWNRFNQRHGKPT
jgi:hypothetical protein